MCSLNQLRPYALAIAGCLIALTPLPLAAPEPAPVASACDALVVSKDNASLLARIRVCNVVLSGEMVDLRWPNFVKYRDELKKFYAPDYALTWTVSGQPTGPALSFVDLLQRADLKGLDADDYDGPRWEKRLRELASSPSPEQLANFDLALSVSAMRYISDLHMGRVNPQAASFGVTSKRLSQAEFLRSRVVNSGNVKATVEQLEPGFLRYRRMLSVLPKYMELERQERENPQPLLPLVKKPVARGGTYPGTALLARKLHLLGDLSADAKIPAETDVYTAALVEAVERFQRSHGLPDDGRITAETIRELNVPMSARLTQLKLTLERWRWLPSSLHSPLVVVNIPEFQLRAYSGPAPEREPAFTTKVIVGKAYNHHTPVFIDEMEHVIFRPFWNVPMSIIRNEILPALRRNPAYLSSHRMEMVSSSGRVEIRQRPGPGNALGLVKFVFPNEYDVYLHGTPEKRLFNRVRRDFSHGCIRVEDPEGLAAWVLRNDPSWTRERILAAMNGERTMQVNLPQHIPVLIFYATAMVDESGVVRFFDDIYKLDAALARALASAPH